jgi:hypothetical protein
VSGAPPQRARLVDPESDGDRTTAALISSLATRLIILHYTSGVSVVGSLLAGLSLAGRETARTAEGARLRRALLASPVTRNGDALWAALRIGDMAAGLPATPVIEHVRNDLALLLAPDLAEALGSIPIPPPLRSRAADTPLGGANFVDCLLGLWAHSREITRSIEALGALAPSAPSTTFEGAASIDESGSPLLR